MSPYLFMIINITITTIMITMDQIKSTVLELVSGRNFAMHDIISFLSMILRLCINLCIVQYFLRCYVCFDIVTSCLSHVTIYICNVICVSVKNIIHHYIKVLRRKTQKSLLRMWIFIFVCMYYYYILRRNVYLLDFFRHI